MFGPPKDIEGECNAHLYIGDDYGDNSSTMRCQLPKGHGGMHRESFRREDADLKTGKIRPNSVVITWQHDERCWHKWIKKDSKQALEYWIEIWEDEVEGAEAFNRDQELHDTTRICVLCGQSE